METVIALTTVWNFKTPSFLKYTDLELAINTIVTQFHAASANEAPTLTVKEFQEMLSKELPSVVGSTYFSKLSCT